MMYEMRGDTPGISYKRWAYRTSVQKSDTDKVSCHEEDDGEHHTELLRRNYRSNMLRW